MNANLSYGPLMNTDIYYYELHFISYVRLVLYYICKHLYYFPFLQGSDNFICNTCQNQYAAKSSLLRHQKMEHGTEQFVCDHCGKRMSRADSKKRHERSCKGDKVHVPSVINAKSQLRVSRNMISGTTKPSIHRH